ncbi:MAG: hypothetical protein U0359_17085 [Byssovorax sp.]
MNIRTTFRSRRAGSTGALCSFAALLLGAGLSIGCARGPDVEATGLGLKRVVIYRNGVGYFEREGHVEADQVTFKVRNEKVGDFLATLAVIEQGGSSVRSASFPVEVEKSTADDDDDDTDGRFEVLLKAPPAKKKSKKDKLETVKLSLDGKEHDLIVGYVAETPVWRPSYRLVITGKKDSAQKGPGTADLQAWGIVQNLSGEDWKGVTLSLVAGAPLAFQATLERAVIPMRPVVSDQGEVIASVPTGETSLGEGGMPPPPPPAPPAAAESAPDDMHSLDGLLANADKDREEQAADEKPMGGARRAPMKKAPARSMGPGGAGKASKGDFAGRSYASAMPKPSYAPVPAAPAPEPMRNPSPPRNVRALAAVAMEAGTTHYDLPFAVDVPNNSATMVLLLSRPVPGESIFLFAPDGGVPESTSHPFRVVRFTNDGKGLLERGPIAVFENGAFLGQGMVDPLPPGATATVPFALERSLAVESARTANEEGARLAMIEGGRIEIERDWVTHTKYTIKNGGDAAGKILVKHPRQYGTRLNNPPKGTEDNTGTGTALVPIDVPARKSEVLDVDERSIQRRGVDWLDPLADDAVKNYMADQRADQAVVAQLRQAWDARGKLRTSLDERDKLNAERAQLDAQIDQLNSSLRAIEKNKLADDLRRQLTERLGKASARIDEITKRSIVLEMQISEQTVRFRDLINPIKMVKPLPVP